MLRSTSRMRLTYRHKRPKHSLVSLKRRSSRRHRSSQSRSRSERRRRSHTYKYRSAETLPAGWELKKRDKNTTIVYANKKIKLETKFMSDTDLGVIIDIDSLNREIQKHPQTDLMDKGMFQTIVENVKGNPPAVYIPNAKDDDFLKVKYNIGTNQYIIQTKTDRKHGLKPDALERALQIYNDTVKAQVKNFFPSLKDNFAVVPLPLTRPLPSTSSLPSTSLLGKHSREEEVSLNWKVDDDLDLDDLLNWYDGAF